MTSNTLISLSHIIKLSSSYILFTHIYESFYNIYTIILTLLTTIKEKINVALGTGWTSIRSQLNLLNPNRHLLKIIIRLHLRSTRANIMLEKYTFGMIKIVLTNLVFFIGRRICRMTEIFPQFFLNILFRT